MRFIDQCVVGKFHHLSMAFATHSSETNQIEHLWLWLAVALILIHSSLTVQTNYGLTELLGMLGSSHT